MDSRESGFTLIELLIVVVVIGILAAIAIPKYNAIREKAFFSTLKADLRNLANLEELYYNDNFSYTTDLTAVGYVNSEAVTMNMVEGTNTGWSASATHLGIPAESCAIYHGGAAQLTPATTVSVIMCSR